MTTCRYPRAVIRGDYVRAGAGFALSVVPLFAVGSVPAVAIIFGLSTTVFVVFGYRTWKRSRLAITVDDKGISTSGAGRATLHWVDVVEVRLNYYTTKRDRSGGWMQLIVKGRTGQVRAESTLDGFEDIARAAAIAARRNKLALNLTTVSNYLALDIDLSDTLPE
jgi:hypothetical protein